MNSMQDNPIILDACTIINLLRIDEDNKLLSLLLGDLKKFNRNNINVHISETVFDEIKANKFRNDIEENKEDEIDRCLYTYIKSLIRLDAEVKKDLIDCFSDMKNYSLDAHSKENGELYSSALSLIISREQNQRAVFYTDDYPAKKEFSDYFEKQQIGEICDSVDLYLYLYWTKSSFSKKMLEDTLKNLYNEYNGLWISLRKEIDNLKCNRKERSMQLLFLDYINKKEYSKLKDLLKDNTFPSKYPTLNKLISVNYQHLYGRCKQEEKILNVLEYIKKHEVFKLN